MHSSLPFSLLMLGLLTASHASESKSEPDYYRDVFPFLKANCISCHNKTTTKAGLNMETPEFMMKGGDSGPAIVAGKGLESLIVQASQHQNDMEMPPANNKSGAVNLTPAEIEVLKVWIDQGAKGSVQEARQVAWQPLAAGVHPIYSVAMTQDGRFAACARSNQIFVYDLATREFVTQITDTTQKSGTAHRALVQSLAFSPDGTRLASGSFREVKIWRQETGQPLSRKADAALGATVSAITSDGRQIISATPTGELLLQEATSGKMLKKITTANPAGIKLLSVTPDGTKVAAYGADATLAVWNLQDGTSLGSKPSVPGVRTLAWTSNGQSLATAGEDKIVRVWTLPATGSTELVVAKELKGASGAITTLIAGSTPDQFIAASEEGKVRVWSIAEAKVAREITSAGIISLALSPDGKQLVMGGAKGVVSLWDVETGKQTLELRGSVGSARQVAAQEWTIAAQQLEQAFQKTVVTRIEAQNKALDELLKKANEAIIAMKKVLPEKEKALKPAQETKATAQKAVDEVVALIAAAPEGKADAALEKKLKDAQEKLLSTTTAETSALAAVSATENNVKDAEEDVKRITDDKGANGKELATATTATETAKKAQEKASADLAAVKLALTKTATKPLAVAFSTDAQSIAAIFDDGTINVWAVASGIPIEQISGSATTTAAALVHGANNTFVACPADGSLSTTRPPAHWVLDRVLGGEKDPTLFVDRINAVRFSPDGKMLATGGGELSRSGDVHLFDAAAGKLLHTWKEHHTDAVLCLDFSPDGRFLASGASDKIARIAEVASGKQTGLFEGHTHYVMGVAFRADGRVLATAGADGVVIAWDTLLGERKKKIEGWTKEVTSLQFIGATNQIVTSAGDNLVRIVSDEGGQIRSIANLPDFMQAAASTPGGTTLIGGGEDSLLRVWDGTNGKEIAVFGLK